MSSSAETLANTTWANLASAMSSLKLVDDLRWASPLEIKKSLENAFTETFGSKDEYTKSQAAAGKAGKAQAKNTKPNGAAAAKDSNPKDAAGTQAGASSAPSAPTTTNMFEEGFLAALHPVGGNPQINERLKEEHLKATGGLVHTRFPPEPNGTFLTSLLVLEILAFRSKLTLPTIPRRLPPYRPFQSYCRELRLRSISQRSLLSPL